jgi:hypothetical protein
MMIRKLIAPIMAALAMCAGSTKAELLFGDGFDYPNGDISAVSGGLWVNHSGTAPLAIVDGRAFVNGGISGSAEDANRSFPAEQQVVYAAFRLSLTNLPTVTTYFAHVKNDTTTFKGRLFAVTNGALAGFYRIGVSAAAGSPAAVYGQDLELNHDYWVVLGWDRNQLLASVWINPTSEGDLAAQSNDPTTDSPATAFAFRQATGEGQIFVDDLQVATTFAEAVTNAPVPTAILVPPASVTLNVGDVSRLFTVATGAGALAFEWKKDGGIVSSGANVLEFPDVQTSDAGSYTVTVTGANGVVVSSPVTVTVKEGVTPPSITSQPADASVALGTDLSLTIAAAGSNPLSYQWFFNSNSIPGEVFEKLPLGSVQSSQAGFYHVEVSNLGGTAKSRVAQVSVRGPISTNIAYLRTLVDTNYVTTDTTNTYTVEGIVTTHSTLTSPGNTLFYIQDGDAGIAVINFGGSTLPAAGDRVRVTGPLSTYNSLLELAPSTANPYHAVEVVSSGNALPAAKTLAFGTTNDLPAIEALEGSLVKVVNVALPTAGGMFAGNKTYVVTNSAGETLAFYVNAQVAEIIGQPIPEGSVTITGVLGQFTSNTTADRKTGYQVIPSQLADIEAGGVVVHPNFTLSVAKGTGGTIVISWPTQSAAAYDVLGAGSVTDTFTNVATGLTFPGGSGSYEVPAAAALGIYRVVTP